MKQAILSALAAAVIFALTPLLARGVSRSGAAPVTETAEAVPSIEAETAAPEAPGLDGSFLLPVLAGEEIRALALDDYLTGVLLAEMPMNFADEALKAQAVACRTYALRSYDHRKHGAAALCTDSQCCQGWVDPDSVDPALRQRAEAAVAATDGLVIRYQGTLIDATFFSCSGGRTEAAAAVWGKEIPYLQAVNSPGEEAATHFTDEVRLPVEDFRRILTEADPLVSFSENPGDWVGQIRYTAGGGVASMLLGGRAFSGRDLRKLFSLRSTAFALTLTETEAVFKTRGWGHRVGLSQWGAEAMARAGADFIEILSHYYTGVTVEGISSK